MSVTQTIDIPAPRTEGSRRLTIDIPNEVPPGKTILTFTPAVNAKMSEAEEIEYINRNADRLNREAEEVLAYQSLDAVGEDLDKLFSGKQFTPEGLAAMGGTVVPFSLADIVRSERASKES